MVFKGVYTAIVTPFESGAIDFDSLTRLVESQIDGGIHGIVACGTTGESATLSDDEIVEITRHVLEVSSGACQVVAGVGSNSTHHTCELLRRVSGLGIDGALVITPYYNKPTQQGLVAHFEAVSKCSPQTPLMLYTVPGRTGVELNVETFASVSRLENVVALKDAAGDLALSAEYVQVAHDGVSVLSGDDVTALPMWSVGGQGLVSVAANIYPRLMVNMWGAYESGDVAAARSLHAKLLPLFRSLFVESNPLPVKYLMAKTKMIPSESLRLPLVPVTAESRLVLDRCISELNLDGGAIYE